MTTQSYVLTLIVCVIVINVDSDTRRLSKELCTSFIILPSNTDTGVNGMAADDSLQQKFTAVL